MQAAAKTLHLFSASQINKWRECQRKWGWRYIAHVPDPAGPAAALGTEVDDTQLQPYLREGRPLDFTRESGYIAAPGLTYLPLPQSHGLQVQKHFVLGSPTSKDFGYQGYIDLWLPLGGLPEQYPGGVDETPPEHRYPVVCDFKTTSNFKYQKHARDLATDVQAQLYATWAMFETKARTIDLVWVYFATKKPYKAKRTHLRVVSDDVGDQFLAINSTAEEMWLARNTVTDPLELPPNTDACESYGGCPYRHLCNLSPSQHIDAKTAQHWAREEVSVSNTAGNGLSALARLRAAKAASAGTPVQERASDPPTPLVVVEAVGINPPESLLPPAPPVGVVANPPPSTLEEPGKKRGRPAGSKSAPKDPVGADVAAHTGLDEASRHQRIGALVIELASLLGIAS